MSVPDQLADELAAYLSPVLGPYGFRYRKTDRAFRRATPHGRDRIDPTVTRAAGGSYTLGFAFGVRHAAAEEVRAALGLPTDPEAATAAQNSFNVHPDRAVRHPGPTFWAVRPPVRWADLLPEIQDFLAAVVVPWLDRFADRRALRAAVAADDGWVTAVRPWEVVAGLDLADGRADELAAYLAGLRACAAGWVPARVGELAEFVRKIAGRLPAGFAAKW